MVITQKTYTIGKIMLSSPHVNTYKNSFLADISHINPPEADKTPGYATKPFNATIIPKSSSNYNNLSLRGILGRPSETWLMRCGDLR